MSELTEEPELIALDDPTNAIIKERNEDMKRINDEMDALVDIQRMMGQYIVEQGEALEVTQEAMNNTKQDVIEGVDQLEISHKEAVKNSKMKMGMAGGGFIGGMTLGAIGLIFGPIPTIAGLALGTVGGAGIGALVIKK